MCENTAKILGSYAPIPLGIGYKYKTNMTHHTVANNFEQHNNFGLLNLHMYSICHMNTAITCDLNLLVGHFWLACDRKP